jgi:hypothetical protein
MPFLVSKTPKNVKIKKFSMINGLLGGLAVGSPPIKNTPQHPLYPTIL